MSGGRQVSDPPATAGWRGHRLVSIYRAPHGSTKRGSGVGIRALAGVGIGWGSGGDRVNTVLCHPMKRGTFVDEGVGIRRDHPNSL